MFSEDYMVFIYEPRRVSDRAKNYRLRLNEDVKTLIERGILDGNIADFSIIYEEMCKKFENNAVIMLDNFASGKYVLPGLFWVLRRSRPLPTAEAQTRPRRIFPII